MGAALAAGGYFLFPTFQYYRLSPSEREILERQKDPSVKKILRLGLDLQGGSHFVLEADTSRLTDAQEASRAVDQSLEVLRNRVDQFGVTEPLIARQGRNWIVVQLAGIKDPQFARGVLGRTALLEFRMEDDTGALPKITQRLSQAKILQDLEMRATAQVAITREEVLVKSTGSLRKELEELWPNGFQILRGKEERWHLLRSSPELTGATLKEAKPTFGGELNQPVVSFELTAEGAKLFSAITEANIGKNLAIVLDGIVQSNPVIRSKIPDGRGVIEGGFNLEHASWLANILSAGALPVPLKIIEERSVGPTLGRDSIRNGILACAVGSAFVFLFMGFYYRLSGGVANVALLLNLFLLLAAMAGFSATLTLPGIAGIILTIGMAVDANVLIFERVREELRRGATTRVAVDTGYEKAFSAILDGNLTTLIAAAFLFQFGTGPIKGFAVTLTLGLAISMFTALLVTRAIFESWLSRQTVSELSI